MSFDTWTPEKGDLVEWRSETGREFTGHVIAEFEGSDAWRWVRTARGMDYLVPTSSLRMVETTIDLSGTWNSVPEDPGYISTPIPVMGAGSGVLTPSANSAIPLANGTSSIVMTNAGYTSTSLNQVPTSPLYNQNQEFLNGAWVSIFKDGTELSDRIPMSKPRRISFQTFENVVSFQVVATKDYSGSLGPAYFTFWDHPVNISTTNRNTNYGFYDHMVCWLEVGGTLSNGFNNVGGTITGQVYRSGVGLYYATSNRHAGAPKSWP